MSEELIYEIIDLLKEIRDLLADPVPAVPRRLRGYSWDKAVWFDENETMPEEK